MRIRVLLDVRKPLKKFINLKMRGGFTNRVSVKYEKIPLFCYHCGKLRHGTKDCDDFHGDGSPTKNFNGSLKASPWRPVKEFGDGEGGASGSERTKRLFITKPAASPNISPIKDKVDSVVHILNKVVLNPIGDEGPKKATASNALAPGSTVSSALKKGLISQENGHLSPYTEKERVKAASSKGSKPRKWKRLAKVNRFTLPFRAMSLTT